MSPLPPTHRALPTSNVLQNPVLNTRTVTATPLGYNPPHFYTFANVIRIFIKIFIVASLYFAQSSAVWVVMVTMIVTEIFEWIVEYLFRKKILPQNIAAILSAAFSVFAITFLLFAASYTSSDWYLLYFVTFTSALSRFQMTGALVTVILSLMAYTFLLIFDKSLNLYYLRVIFLGLVGWRIIDTGRLILELYNDRKKALETDKIKDDFIAITSHNLRTPISALKGYLEILLTNEAGPFNPEQKEILEKLQANTDQLEDVVEEILGISILESKTYDVIKKVGALENIVKESVETHQPVASKKGLSLTYRFERIPLPLISIDKKKIKSVLDNLLDNAIKFTHQGFIQVYVYIQGDSLVTVVEDSGIGIPQEEINNIFQKFKRVGNILVYDYKGAGLGLYISKKIIDSHGGKIWAQSEVGKGTNMFFSLPIYHEL